MANWLRIFPRDRIAWTSWFGISDLEVCVASKASNSHRKIWSWTSSEFIREFWLVKSLSWFAIEFISSNSVVIALLETVAKKIEIFILFILSTTVSIWWLFKIFFEFYKTFFQVWRPLITTDKKTSMVINVKIASKSPIVQNNGKNMVEQEIHVVKTNRLFDILCHKLSQQIDKLEFRRNFF